DRADSSGRVLFDGLRFSDNRYVTGHVDAATGEVHVAAALGARWMGFQAFG
ncbi:MAG: hypothetical protein JWO69_294, partial [Thermoleophilia bacterium]|nr:hypothetical protein [Thermoleophilia bacterium]